MQGAAVTGFSAAASQPWINAGQSLLELKFLKEQQRYHMAMQESFDSVLDYASVNSLYECKVPQSLTRAQQSLQQYANELQQKGDCHQRQEDRQGFCGDVVSKSDDDEAVASQMYAQLLRLIAADTGMEVLELDIMAMQYFKDLSNA